MSQAANTISIRRALLLAAACACALIALGGRAQAHVFTTGLQDLSAYDSADPLAFARTEDAGARYIRITVRWNDVAPATKPNPTPILDPAWDPSDPGSPYYRRWSLYDNQIRQAAAHNLEPILDVTDTPTWARANGCSGTVACAPTAGDFSAFATAVARRYSGGFDPDGAGPQAVLPRVRYYQALNEPNLDFFFKPVFQNGRPASPDIYRNLLNAFYDAVHGVDNSNLVLSAGLAPLARPGHTIGPLDFMRRLLCMSGRKKPKPSCGQTAKLDIWATHPYTTGGPTHSAPGPDDVSLGDLPQMTTLLRAADKAGHIVNPVAKTPFWVTEFSWDSKPPDRGGLPLGLHARWLAEAFYRMYKAGVSNVVWFMLRDEAKNGRPDADVYQSGLYLRGGTLQADKPKPALEAFRFPFVALRTKTGFLFWGRTPDSSAGTVRIELKDKGGFRKVKTAHAAGSGIFTGTVRSSSKTGKVRAKVTGKTSVPFSLKYVKDFYQPPFGGKRAARALTPRRF